MNREYAKWHSPALGRDMELLEFGHSGQPVVVFPTSMGRFYDFEERGMVAAVAPAIDSGRLRLVCVDSVDSESWYNKQVHPAQRAARHTHYDRYLTEELVPHVHSRSGAGRVALTGCSFGGYHTINFALRHPWLVNYAVSMGGAFDIHQFIGSHYDDNCYYNCPPDFLPGLDDHRYLHELRHHTRIVLATGENDICLEENRRLSGIMDAKGIPHTLDVWGDGTGHDWPWWRDMARKFFL
jgi:esterase/lipase superfamily enzyme